MFETILIITVILTNATIYFFLNDKERYKAIYLKTSIALITVSLIYYLAFKPETFSLNFLSILFFFSIGLIIMHYMQIPIDNRMDQFVQQNKENTGLQKMREFQKTIISSTKFLFFPGITIVQIIMILSLEMRLDMIHK